MSMETMSLITVGGYLWQNRTKTQGEAKMQNREKQIEKMIKVIEKCSCAYTPCDSECAQCSNVEMYEDNINHIARTLYEAGYRKQEWISVEERLPEEGGTYLIVLKEKYESEKEWRYHVDAASFIFDWDCIFHDWDEGQEIHITHWMPLPEAPKMKGGAE
jgi:cupin superfamily acireductone dioxygenase involved in methionine salvage